MQRVSSLAEEVPTGTHRQASADSYGDFEAGPDEVMVTAGSGTGPPQALRQGTAASYGDFDVEQLGGDSNLAQVTMARQASEDPPTGGSAIDQYQGFES